MKLIAPLIGDFRILRIFFARMLILLKFSIGKNER